jgi:hypothetical protein
MSGSTVLQIIRRATDHSVSAQAQRVTLAKFALEMVQIGKNETPYTQFAAMKQPFCAIPPQVHLSGVSAYRAVTHAKKKQSSSIPTRLSPSMRVEVMVSLQ